MKRLQIERPLLIVTVSILTSCNGGTGGRFPETSGNIPGPAATASTPGSEDGQWLTPAKDYASTRYSQLDQTTTSNVSSLKPAWSFSTGLNRGHEAAPIVVKDTMYIPTPFPNYLYALDLNKPGTMKWVYKPGPSPSAQGVACCDVVNRGAAYYNGRIYYNTLDNHTVAVDAITGKEVWKTLLGDINKGESMTMAPLVAKGRVFVGNSGGEFGIRGWLSGLDADSGKIMWRGYCCGPDRDVLIGPNFKPFYQADRQPNLGQTTWPNDLWKIGGGGAWGWISYDPELDLIYYGTSNPGPWNSEQRPGDNKWTASIFARRPDTGEAIWAYQYSPHDTFDYDAVNENVLLDLNIKGKVRKTLIQPDRNGFMYVIDPQMVHEKTPGFGRIVRDICPAAPGSKDWQPMAYSFHTGLLYIPHNNLCMEEEGVEGNYIAGTPYVGANVRMYAGPGGHRGLFTAWDPVAGKVVWQLKEKFPVWSGALVTKTDVALYGTMDGYFKAVNARTGDQLWQFKLPSGIIGQPVTFTGPDKKQYVAILSEVGGWAGAVVAGNLDTRDGTDALGFVNAMQDLPQATNAGGTLHVFALP
jgi:alcohol dehydrogenase (cytochrome c)